MKSGPLTSTLIECEVEPLVAVTVALKVPSAEETVNIDVAEVVVGDSIMVEGLSVVMLLPDGTAATRLMVPENPLKPVIVRVEDAEDPELTVTAVGLETTLKSGTVIETVV